MKGIVPGNFRRQVDSYEESVLYRPSPTVVGSDHNVGGVLLGCQYNQGTACRNSRYCYSVL